MAKAPPGKNELPPPIIGKKITVVATWHPGGPSDTGHQALAELLAGVVQTAVKNVAEAASREAAAGGSSPLLDSLRAGGGRGSAAAAAPAKAVKLPPPMIPGNAAHATTLCAMQVSASVLVADMSGLASGCTHALN